jgi:segregation and condensation protein A
VHRATFRQLASDCAGTYEVVARFLAVLELYREGNVILEQAEPLGDLYVTWSPHAPPVTAGAGEEEDGKEDHA